MLRVVICISTLHRPEGLGRILRSLAAQTARMLETVDLRVVVANNDPNDPRPTSVADEVRRATDLAVEVLHEARRGVAPPRNLALGRAIELAGGDGMIGFLDDDEETLLADLHPAMREALHDALRTTYYLLERKLFSLPKLALAPGGPKPPTLLRSLVA